MEKNVIAVVADNVQKLMMAERMAQAALAARARISQKTVSDLLNFGRTKKSPTLSTVAKIADAFGLPPWLLQVPDLPLELLQNRRVEKLVENYRDGSDVSRDHVDYIAEGTLRYRARG